MPEANVVLEVDRDKLAEMVAAAESATEHRLLYGDPGTEKPGLWLVADHGVYLMSNQVLPEGQLPTVLYAKGADPNIYDFDDWWALRDDVFDGDDGVEFFDLATFKKLLATADARFTIIRLGIATERWWLQAVA